MTPQCQAGVGAFIHLKQRTMTTSLPHGSSALHRHNLPAEIASFVGRGRELGQIKGLLPRTRLLTLTGAGDCGKTRLALRVATDVAHSFPDGVWLIQLAPLADSALVPRAVAAALGMAGRPLLTTLAAALAPRRLLLVLDNCEHLLGACARLAETLLHACPHLQILATSREPLRVPSEITWRVPSLALPGPGQLPPPESLAQVEAVALFLDRAIAQHPDYSLTPYNARAVAAICRQLEGIPLAIELAAACCTTWAIWRCGEATLGARFGTFGRACRCFATRGLIAAPEAQ
jgi:predicted ATPase